MVDCMAFSGSVVSWGCKWKRKWLYRVKGSIRFNSILFVSLGRPPVYGALTIATFFFSVSSSAVSLHHLNFPHLITVLADD